MCTRILLPSHTPGAGGYGDPKKEKPEAVLSDVIERGREFIDKPRKFYGVKIEKDGSSFRLA